MLRFRSFRGLLDVCRRLLFSDAGLWLCDVCLSLFGVLLLDLCFLCFLWPPFFGDRLLDFRL